MGCNLQIVDSNNNNNKEHSDITNLSHGKYSPDSESASGERIPIPDLHDFQN